MLRAHAHPGLPAASAGPHRHVAARWLRIRRRDDRAETFAQRGYVPAPAVGPAWQDPAARRLLLLLVPREPWAGDPRPPPGPAARPRRLVPVGRPGRGGAGDRRGVLGRHRFLRARLVAHPPR